MIVRNGNEGDILEQKMCKEVEILEKKYETTAGDLDINDLKKLDLLYHTLKSKAGYEKAVYEASEYGYENGQMSGRRGYSGRMSGHYPESEYYPPRRW